jgi:hypothetical protein
LLEAIADIVKGFVDGGFIAPKTVVLVQGGGMVSGSWHRGPQQSAKTG